MKLSWLRLSLEEYGRHQGYGRSWWLSPNGKFISVISHSRTAIRLAQEIAPEKCPKNWADDPTLGIDILKDLGWVRISGNSYTNDIYIDSNCQNWSLIQKAVLQARELHNKKVILDVGSFRGEFFIDDILNTKSLSDLINKTKHIDTTIKPARFQPAQIGFYFGKPEGD